MLTKNPTYNSNSIQQSHIPTQVPSKTEKSNHSFKNFTNIAGLSTKDFAHKKHHSVNRKTNQHIYPISKDTDIKFKTNQKA